MEKSNSVTIDLDIVDMVFSKNNWAQINAFNTDVYPRPGEMANISIQRANMSQDWDSVKSIIENPLVICIRLHANLFYLDSKWHIREKRIEAIKIARTPRERKQYLKLKQKERWEDNRRPSKKS